MQHLSPAGAAYFSGTYNGNVVSVAAALETIRILDEQRVIPQIAERGKYLQAALNARFAAKHAKCQAVVFGSVVALHFAQRELHNLSDVMTGHDHVAAAKLTAFLFQDGIYIKPRRVPRFLVSQAHSLEDLQATIAVIDRLFDH